VPQVPKEEDENKEQIKTPCLPPLLSNSSASLQAIDNVIKNTIAQIATCGNAPFLGISGLFLHQTRRHYSVALAARQNPAAASIRFFALVTGCKTL